MSMLPFTSSGDDREANGWHSKDPTDLSQGNWGLWSFRGKRYEATRKDLDE